MKCPDPCQGEYPGDGSGGRGKMKYEMSRPLWTTPVEETGGCGETRADSGAKMKHEMSRPLPGASIVAEIGDDVKRFPSEGHLLSWTGLCPRSHESAGKRRSTRIRQGAPWLEPMLVQAAWSSVRVKGSYARAVFHRLEARRGQGLAIIAVAASMLGAIYHILSKEVPYKELGADHFDKKSKDRIIRGCIRRLEQLGCKVDPDQQAA